MAPQSVLNVLYLPDPLHTEGKAEEAETHLESGTVVVGTPNVVYAEHSMDRDEDGSSPPMGRHKRPKGFRGCLHRDPCHRYQLQLPLQVPRW